MKNQHQNLIKRWVDELQADMVNVDQAREVARALAEKIYDSAQMRQLVSALKGNIDDPLDCDISQEMLPELIQAQLEGRMSALEPEPLADVRTHLMLCPHCMAAYAEVSEMVQQSLADAVPMVDSYPNFDLTFLTSSTASTPITNDGSAQKHMVQQALETGREWIQDALGGITLIFGPGIQAQSAAGWTVKSSQSERLLAQITLGEEELEGWEIESTVFADVDDASLCQVEVSLYLLETPDADLVGIPVVLYDGDTEVIQITDHRGIAEFDAIPLERLPKLGIHIQLPA
ncbi:hypothetical protein KFU94_67600 [Chloroflexi bacterium TSY]|nr:hypothetical protein [Chloroflexi bacterium TSY]